MSATPRRDQPGSFQRCSQPIRFVRFYLHGARREHLRPERHTQPRPSTWSRSCANFQTPMNHAYNLTVEQQLTATTVFSLGICGNTGRDLVNWRDLNACPVSTLTRATPLGSRCGAIPAIQPILQLNNDGYSNYNSLQTAFKVRDIHGLTGQMNFVWSRDLRYRFRQSRRQLPLRLSRTPTRQTRAMRRRTSTRPGTSISPSSMSSENSRHAQTDGRRVADQLALPRPGWSPIYRCMSAAIPPTRD